MKNLRKGTTMYREETVKDIHKSAEVVDVPFHLAIL